MGVRRRRPETVKSFLLEMDKFYKIDKNISNCRLNASLRGVLSLLYEKYDYAIFKKKVKDDWFPCSKTTLSKELLCQRGTVDTYIDSLVSLGYLQVKCENGKTTLFKFTLPETKTCQEIEQVDKKKDIKPTCQQITQVTCQQIEQVNPQTCQQIEQPIRLSSIKTSIETRYNIINKDTITKKHITIKEALAVKGIDIKNNSQDSCYLWVRDNNDTFQEIVKLTGCTLNDFLDYYSKEKRKIP